MLWWDRMRVAVRSLGYRHSWSFRLRQSLAMLHFLRGTRPIWRGGVAEMNVYSPPVGSPAYPRYLDGLWRMGHGEWTPMVAHLSITDRCRNRCRRCSNVPGIQDDPPLSVLARRIESLRTAGTCRIALTGGEPLLRGDLEQIVERCGPGLAPVLFTSGDGLDEQRATALRCAGLSAVYVSLDHPQAAVHDAIRGRMGVFDAAVAAIRASRAAELFTAVQAVVGVSLLDDGSLERFCEFCRDLGADEVMLLEETILGQGNDAKADAAVRERLASIHVRSVRDATMPKIASMSWLESEDCLGCQAGFTFLYVSARGEVLPCDFVPLSFGNLDEVGLDAIQARMCRLLKNPSSRCLARRLPSICRTAADRPTTWEETLILLNDYSPGSPPRMIENLCHGSRQ